MDGHRAAAESGGHRRDQPARGDRRGAAPPRPVRPRDRRRRARRARPARDPRHPYPRHAAGRRGQSRRAGAAHLRLRRRRPGRADPRGGAGGGAADHAQAQSRRRDHPDRSARRAVGRAQRLRQCAEARPAVGDARSDGRRCRTSAGTMSAGSTRRATSCARGSSCRSSIPMRSSGSASARPRASCSTARRAPARPCWPRRRRARARPISSPPSRATCCRKWYGESEQQIARLFARARQVAPTVIFIDELDSLVPARGGGMGEPQVTERVVNTILAEMDGLEELNNVVLIGATNRPNLIDPALLRPGPVRRADLCRHARHRRAPPDPGDPHQGHAAGQGRRPRSRSPGGPSASPAPTWRIWCAAPA